MGWTEFAGLDIEGQRMTIYKGIFYLRSYGNTMTQYKYERIVMQVAGYILCK